MMKLDPPIPFVQAGRPRKARRRDATEDKNHGHKLRKTMKIHCRNCGNVGHNAATCKKPKDVPVSATQEVRASSSQPPNQSSRSEPVAMPRRSPRNKTRLEEGQSSNQPPPIAKTGRPPKAKRQSDKHPLTEGDKLEINRNYAYLGEEPPYKVGNWLGRSRGRGRGRGRGERPPTNATETTGGARTESDRGSASVRGKTSVRGKSNGTGKAPAWRL